MVTEAHAPTAVTPAAIQILPPEVVERIAAGEVIERPVSVVRELLDNALDAGAGQVRIDIRGGGLRSIRVSDDGAGIPAGEVELALRHHATNKIRAAEDLATIGTLGFRGEALPSIAAVSDLSLHTAAGDAGVGVRLDRRHGAPESREYLSRMPGTTVTVRNLFANVPARLKFIGNARAESSHISSLVRRYALAHPTVRFALTLDGHSALHTSGQGLNMTVGEVFGATVARALLPFGPIQEGEATLSGLISGNQVTRSSRNHITLLVNDRCVTSRPLLAAFEAGYRALVPRGRHPIAVLQLQVPSTAVDVNVHPSKGEVKIEGEARLATTLGATTRAVLGRHLPAPSGDTHFALGAEQLQLPRTLAERGPEYGTATRDLLLQAEVRGQVRGSLILLEDTSGLYLVDQHRAHERAIYELLQRRHTEGRAGQLLLEPLQIELSRHQMARLEPRLAELATLGFNCEWFGGRSFLIRSIPVIPETGDLPGVIEDLLDLATHDDGDWQHRLLTSIACRSATRRGRALTLSGCRELIDLLGATESPAVCPHGSPIILHFSEHFLHRQFDW